MNNIRPVSDLRNHFSDISKTVHETKKPVFLTKNGYGDMVVMSIEAYEDMQFDNEVNLKLAEFESEYETSDKLYTSEEILEAMKKIARGQ